MQRRSSRRVMGDLTGLITMDSGALTGYGCLPNERQQESGRGDPPRGGEGNTATCRTRKEPRDRCASHCIPDTACLMSAQAGHIGSNGEATGGPRHAGGRALARRLRIVYCSAYG